MHIPYEEQLPARTARNRVASLRRIAADEANVIHIGYPKTGTTLLQDQIFPQMLPYFEKMGLRLESNEELSGDLFQDDPRLAKELRAINSQAKVIICIRSQFSILPSLYWSYIKAGGNREYVDYIYTSINNGKLFYFDLVEEYLESFGDENVRVLLYEDLVRDQANFVRQIMEFCGLAGEKLEISFPASRINARPIEMHILATRAINRLLGYNYGLNFRDVGTARYRLRMFFLGACALAEKGLRKGNFAPLRSLNFERYAPIIEEGYRDQNAKIDSELRLPVAAYGYPGFDSRH